MEPAVSAGDLVLVHRREAYGRGDIVMFDNGGISVTHRIVKKAKEGFVTKGDANNVPDIRKCFLKNRLSGWWSYALSGERS